ncbi:MAG: ATP-binding protein [Desulfobacterales bacterium]
MGTRGLKTKIAISFTLILLLGMFSIDFVTMMTAQNSLIRSEVAKGQTVSRLLGDYLLTHSVWEDDDITGGSRAKLGEALEESGAVAFLMLDGNQRQFGFGMDRAGAPEELVEMTRQALAEVRTGIHFSGSTFGLFWWQKRSLVISAPLMSNGVLQGAFSLVFPMQSIYQSLRNSQQVLFLYIFLNTALLSFLGLYRVFKIYLQPLARLAKRAEDYKGDDEIVFAVRKEDNELQRLSSALNGLMRRLAAEKEKLRQTVTSLERANSDLQKAQTEIIRAEKLASVGRLSAGIAHEIGNPIGIVTGYLELLKQGDLAPDEGAEYIDRAQKEIDRISTIIRQLLEISRPSPAGSLRVSVHALIDEMAQVLSVQPFMSHLRFVTRLDARHDVVVADTNQLRQVFLNLVINAADAIASRADETPGELVVTTEEVCGAVDSAGDVKPRLLVRFRDNGTGIGAKHLSNIFDPFFTTKEPGKGTGLGLAVSFMIVERFGGRIDVESTVGSGTTLTVVLPVFEHPSPLDPSPVCPEKAPIAASSPQAFRAAETAG